MSSKNNCSYLGYRIPAPILCCKEAFVSASFCCIEETFLGNQTFSYMRRCASYFHKKCLYLSSSIAFPTSVNAQDADYQLRRKWRIRSSRSIYLLLSVLLSQFPLSETADRRANLHSSYFGHRAQYRSDLYLKKERSRCENIEEPLCKDIGYNQTDMALSPTNLFKQSDARPAVKEFISLFEIGCAAEMKLLVCSIYTPICMPSYPKFLPPCRHICEQARKGCWPLFQKFQVPWPDLFQCDRYPDFDGDNQLCLHFNRSTVKEQRSSVPPSPNKLKERMVSTETMYKPTEIVPFISSKNAINQTREAQCQCRCVPPMVKITDPSNDLYNKVHTGWVRNCALPCRSPYFNDEKLRFAELWITAWSVICFFVTLVTVSTFLIDASHFESIERPIIYLATCYMFVSVGALIRVVAGHEAVGCVQNSDQVLYQTTGPFLCAVVFLLVYLFGMAAMIWWVFLSLTWCLAVGRTWGTEAIAHFSPYSHAASWLIPAVQTIGVLAMSAVDGDPLSGLCYVGNQDFNFLKAYIICPLILYLGLGSFFLLLGSINLCRLRDFRSKVRQTENTSEALIKRVFIYLVVCMTCFIGLLYCHFYELQNRHMWENAYNCRMHNGSRCIYGTKTQPAFYMFIIKYTAMFFIGIISGFSICSSRTIAAWKKFYQESSKNVCGMNKIIPWFKQICAKKNLNDPLYLKKDTTCKPHKQCVADKTRVTEECLLEINHENTNVRSPDDSENSSRYDSSVTRACSPLSGLSSVFSEAKTSKVASPSHRHLQRFPPNSSSSSQKFCCCVHEAVLSSSHGMAESTDETKVQIQDSVTAKNLNHFGKVILDINSTEQFNSKPITVNHCYSTRLPNDTRLHSKISSLCKCNFANKLSQNGRCLARCDS